MCYLMAVLISISLMTNGVTSNLRAQILVPFLKNYGGRFLVFEFLYDLDTSP